MIRLMREVRFFRNGSDDQEASSSSNHWAGTAPDCAPPFWVVQIVVEGPSDSHTGYVCDIKLLDDLVRTRLAPRLSTGAPTFDDVGRLLSAGFETLAAGLPPSLRLISAELHVSPFTRLTAGEESPVLLLTQCYEFSASHRLSCVGLSDEENFQLFGKCSNPNGHGHNYLLEITVAADGAGVRSTLTDLDRKVKRHIIDRFDHKNLNLECQEFADVNPTVENIAQVIFDCLVEALAPLRLSNVRVWETAKTYAECSDSRTIR